MILTTPNSFPENVLVQAVVIAGFAAGADRLQPPIPNLALTAQIRTMTP